MLCTQVLLLGAATLCAASPARLFNRNVGRNTLGTVATVDCSNRQAVEFVSKTHANFRCVYPDNRRSSPVISENNAPLFRFSSRFPSGLHSASLIKQDTSNCPTGKLYVPSIDMCLDAVKPLHTAQLHSDNLIVDETPLEIQSFSSNIQFASDCNSDQVYNSELSLCMLAKPPPKIRSPLQSLNLVKDNTNIPLEIQAFSSAAQSSADCKPGEMWVNEISACVSISNSSPLESASLIRSESTLNNKPNTAKDCASGEVFVSELTICLPANPSKIQKPLVSDSLVADISPPVAVIDKLECPQGQVLVSELNICLPFNPPKGKVTVPSSSNLVKEPEKLEIVAFATSMTKDDCKEGQFYLSELGICA